MSKYNLCIRESRRRRLVVWLIYGLIAASIATWQDDIIVYQTLWQWLLASLVLLAGWQKIRQDKLNDTTRWLNVDESGKGQWIDQAQLQQWQVSKHSRMTEFALWITLVDSAQPTHKEQYVWLASQFSVRDYRRLCRIIARCQHQSQI